MSLYKKKNTILRTTFLLLSVCTLVGASVASVYASEVYTTHQIPYTVSANQAPTVTCSAPQAVTYPSSATISASASDSDGTITQTAWTLKSGPVTPTITPAGSTNATLTSTISGWRQSTVEDLYTFTFTATDNKGTKTTCTADVYVDPAAAMPDLTVGSVSPTTVVVGTASSLQAPVTNQGTDTTGIGFYNLFQALNYCADENGTCSFSGTKDVFYGANGTFATKTGVTGSITCSNSVFGDPIPFTAKRCYYLDNLAATSVGALAAGATVTATSASYAFQTIGNSLARACADKRNASTVSGDIDPELDEGNNCGTWTAVTVATGIGPVGVTLYGNGLTNEIWINKGSSATLTWSSTNATSCNNGTNFSTGGALNNATGVTVSPTTGTTYSITCSNSGGSATSSFRVQVVVPACNNTVDDDGDGKTDYPADPGCTDSNDSDETNAATYACSNTIDDDGDGKIDYGTDPTNDPGCSSLSDQSERDPKNPVITEPKTLY